MEKVRQLFTCTIEELRACWRLLTLYVAFALLMVFFIPWFLCEVMEGPDGT